MYAVIKTGGKQYLTKLGQRIKIEKLDKKVGESVSFGEPLLVFDEEKGGVEIGSPSVKTEVSGKVIEQAKAKKITIIKYKAKKRYHKKQGHRQNYTLVEITKIGNNVINKGDKGNKGERGERVEKEEEKKPTQGRSVLD